MGKRIRKQLNIEVPEALYHRLKIHCALSGNAMRAFALEAIRAKLDSDAISYAADLKAVLMFLRGRYVMLEEPSGREFRPEGALEVLSNEELSRKVILLDDEILQDDADKKGELSGTVIFKIKVL